MEFPSKLEMHYYLSDGSHSMNALVKNQCEAEFIAVAVEAAKILDLQIELNTEALQEGGIREIWTALGDNSAQIALIISTLALIFSVVPREDQELIDLQKEDLRLSLEERRASIKKLKEEIKNNDVSEDSVKRAAKIASSSYKVATRKSNFYKKIVGYKKVVKIGYSGLDKQGAIAIPERQVDRASFKNFILASNDLKPVRVEEARIEVVAPVLNDGKAKWKGLYDGQTISFSMNDSDFKASVLSRAVSFKNGDEIICVLSIHKKVDELGEVITSGYSIETVLENVSSGDSHQTRQGKTHRHAKVMSDGQSDFFEDKDK